MTGTARPAPRAPARRGWIGAIQAAATVVVGLLVWRALARHWDDFRSVELEVTLRPGWVALAAAAVFVTYALQIQSWRYLLDGWRQSLSYGRAARIWLVVNLGRYVPGKIWSVAGLIVLAQEAGVAPWAAAASTVAVQALGVGTAVGVVAAVTPGAASPARLAAALLAALGLIVILGSAKAARWIGRMAGTQQQLQPLPLAAAARAAALTLAAWLVYGLAFWLLARGLGLPGAFPLPLAVGVFALGYVLGLLALLAPGGVGVRELAFVGLLTPSLGGGGAIALSVASRLLLTATEVAAPLVTLWLTRGRKEALRGR
ncbi:MAG TPA: lysylphosphatidylglycerol synthase domain-containing protein [Gemmatimonadales bacterium]|nr:lysylphosphatidylglycerol synthase domain-containing protein [Gemmatimonadales bacterium]